MFITRLHEADTLLHVVVIEKCDKESCCIPMRAQNVLFDQFPAVIHVHEYRRSSQSFHNWFECIEQWIIESCINPNQFTLVICAASNKTRNILLCPAVENLSISEKILLANAQCKFSDRVAEHSRQVAFQVTQRINAKPVNVVSSDHILVSANEETLEVPVCRKHLLQRGKITDRVVCP